MHHFSIHKKCLRGVFYDSIELRDGQKTLLTLDMAENKTRFIQGHSSGEISPETVQGALEYLSSQNTKEAKATLEFLIEEYV